MAWPILTTPKSRGGLGLIDPLSQSKALLAKFVVRGLQPGNDCWKMLLRLHFAYFRPRKGVKWAPQTGWILNMDLKPSFSRQLEDRFSASMWKVWCDIRRGSSAINRVSNQHGSFNVSYGTHVSRMNLINYLVQVRGCHGDTWQKVQEKV